jgi:hypothetical protein
MTTVAMYKVEEYNSGEDYSELLACIRDVTSQMLRRLQRETAQREILEKELKLAQSIEYPSAGVAHSEERSAFYRTSIPERPR